MDAVLTSLEQLNGFDWRQFALDVETTSLVYSELDLVGVGICNGKDTYYMDCKQFPFFIDKLTLRVPRSTRVIFHNASFDIKVLNKFGIKVPQNIFDTQVAAHLLDENDGYGLAYLAQKYLGVAKQKPFLHASQLGLHNEEFYEYALPHSRWTWQLYKLFKGRLRKEGLENLFYGIEMPFQFVLVKMETEGVKVSGEHLEGLRKESILEANNLLIEMYKLLGLHYSWCCDIFTGEREVLGVNFASPEVLLDIIEGLGFKVTERTEKGNLSVGDKTIQRLVNKHTFFALLKRWKELNKLLTGFVKPLFEQVEKDGKVRASYKDCGTRIGRLSCVSPNLQQLPISSKD